MTSNKKKYKKAVNHFSDTPKVTCKILLNCACMINLVASTNFSNPYQYQQNSLLSINDSLNSPRLSTGMSPDISPKLSTINLEQIVNLLRPQLPIQHNPTIVANSCDQAVFIPSDNVVEEEVDFSHTFWNDLIDYLSN